VGGIVSIEVFDVGGLALYFLSEGGELATFRCSFHRWYRNHDIYVA